MFAALGAVSGAASAITGAVTVTFGENGAASAAPAANTGVVNLAALPSSTSIPFPPFSVPGYYSENGMVVGVVNDPLATEIGDTPHWHGEAASSEVGGSVITAALGDPNAMMASVHNDDNGLYIRAVDSSAFSFNSMYFDSAISAANPNTNGVWDIYGYSTAANPNLLSGAIGANYLPTDPQSGNPSGQVVAFQQVTNGFDGLLSLSSAFNNVSSVWIHYDGVTDDPRYYGLVTGTTPLYQFEVTDLSFSAAVTAVPVPAAVWLFASGLAGLLSFGKRKHRLVS